MKNDVFALVVTISVAVSGCVGYQSKTTMTGPTAAGVNAMMGNWTSATASVIPAAAACTDFKWNVTEQTSNTAKGTFSASCAGVLKVAGTATGTLNGTAIDWAANANASAPGITSCAILLAGTAELGVDSIRVPYSGTTCLGPVSGVEILKR